MNARIFAASMAVLVAGAMPALAQDKGADGAVVQKIGHGEINWSTKTVKATGSGAANLKDGPVAVARLNAERAAKLDALRNILETLKGVQVNGKRTVGDMMSNGTVKAKIEGIARGYRVVDTRYYSDGSVDVVVEMPINDDLTSALKVEPKRKKKVNTAGATTITGLIINAKGLDVTPSIAPRIVDEKGKEVYGAAMIAGNDTQEGGIANYVNDVEKAKSNKLVGKSPLVVKALRLAKKAKTDLVISNADADKLRDKGINQSFLAEGRVVIVAE